MTLTQCVMRLGNDVMQMFIVDIHMLLWEYLQLLILVGQLQHMQFDTTNGGGQFCKSTLTAIYRSAPGQEKQVNHTILQTTIRISFFHFSTKYSVSIFIEKLSSNVVVVCAEEEHLLWVFLQYVLYLSLE